MNPHYIAGKLLRFRLQKSMDGEVASASTVNQTNAKIMDVAEQKLGFR